MIFFSPYTNVWMLVYRIAVDDYDEAHDLWRTVQRCFTGMCKMSIHVRSEKICYMFLIILSTVQHWPHLRKHNGERYAYSSHSQAVLDCLRNRSEWARLVDRGPKVCHCNCQLLPFMLPLGKYILLYFFHFIRDSICWHDFLYRQMLEGSDEGLMLRLKVLNQGITKVRKRMRKV